MAAVLARSQYSVRLCSDVSAQQVRLCRAQNKEGARADELTNPLLMESVKAAAWKRWKDWGFSSEGWGANDMTSRTPKGKHDFIYSCYLCHLKSYLRDRFAVMFLHRVDDTAFNEQPSKITAVRLLSQSRGKKNK
ncbi:Hypothetical predicted protein [Xyrichtys novacula]|uniref:Uncharacterized protein n=1 Tax=Xyrichtys novacula TaxID=13765 RepID=A0AAV1GXS9_XYRNO|nr:Hypothetical predicted protein [Xyrichtys novacula]